MRLERPFPPHACGKWSSCLRLVEPSAFRNTEFTALRNLDLNQLVLPTALLAEINVSINSLDCLVFDSRCAPGATGAFPTVSDGERRAGILHALLDNMIGDF